MKLLGRHNYVAPPPKDVVARAQESINKYQQDNLVPPDYIVLTMEEYKEAFALANDQRGPVKTMFGIDVLIEP